MVNVKNKWHISPFLAQGGAQSTAPSLRNGNLHHFFFKMRCRLKSDEISRMIKMAWTPCVQANFSILKDRYKEMI